MRVIYTDVDGTLVGPGGCLFLDSKKNYTLEPAKTIVAALRKGIDIVMVSGRNRDQLREDARIMGLKNYIAELGAEIIYDLGKRIVPCLTDFATKESSVYEEIKNRGIIERLFSHFSGHLEYHTPWSEEKRYYSHLLRGLIEVEEANRFLEMEGSPDLKMADNGRISQQGNLTLVEMHAYHLLPKSVSKAVALQRDQLERNIKKEEAIAIGDSWADLPLAKQVSTFFLVANGPADDPSLQTALAQYDNVFLTKNEKGLGWAEAVKSVLSS